MTLSNPAPPATTLPQDRSTPSPSSASQFDAFTSTFLLAGPVKLHPRVQQAMATPSLNHRGEYFHELVGEIRDLRSLPHLIRLLERSDPPRTPSPDRIAQALSGRPDLPQERSESLRIVAEGEGAVRLVSDAGATVFDVLLLTLAKYAGGLPPQDARRIQEACAGAMGRLPPEERTRPIWLPTIERWRGRKPLPRERVARGDIGEGRRGPAPRGRRSGR